MPRKARVPFETLFSVLKSLPLFNENGHLKRKKDPVWEQAANILNKQVHLHTLYLFVYQNRHDVKTKLMEHFNITTVIPEEPVLQKKKRITKKLKKQTEVHSHGKWDEFDYYESLDVQNEVNEDKKSLSDFNTLLSMINSTEYRDIIHKLGVLPFSVCYWHPQQINLCKDLAKTQPVLSFIVLNNLIKDITDDFDSGNIFVYALAFQKGDTTLLLSQMMSSSLKSLDIEHFLTLWVQSSCYMPSEMIVGYSYSLLDAASMSFNTCNFDVYNKSCFRYLINDMSDLPPTLIRVDLITLIKVVDGWPCFNNILQSVKDLYLCSIMYLSKLDDLEQFRETVISLLTLCQSPFESEGTEIRRQALWEHLTTEMIQQMNREYIQYVTGKHGVNSFSFFNKVQEIPTNDGPHEIYDYINQLKLDAFELCDFSIDSEKTPNTFYCPIILDNLMQLLVEFPSWTNLVPMKINNSTLVASCSTKHLSALSEVKEPVDAPQFLVYHTEKIQKIIFVEKNSAAGKKNVNHVYVVETKNNIPQLVPSSCELNEHDYNNCDTNETNVTPETVGLEETGELDLATFKSTIRSTMHSLKDFDNCVEHILDVQLQPGQEILVTKCLLDCCAELKMYENLFGIIAERFCKSSNVFASSFKEIFEQYYDTIELLENSELKNIGRLFSHLLATNSVSITILSVFKLNQRDISNAKKMFIRVTLRELSERLGMSKLQEKFQMRDYKTTFKGLFPTNNTRDTNNAIRFYESCSLDELANLLRDEKPKIEPGNTLVRSQSNESIHTAGSEEDFVIEVRVSKPKNNAEEVTKKVVVLKK